MRASIPIGMSERQITPIMAAHPNEVVYQWILAYEYIYHNGVAPKGGLDNDQGPRPPEPTDTISRGLAGSYAGVGPGRDAKPSLGVRHWSQDVVSLGVSAIDPIYGTVNSHVSEFPNEPNIILGYVEYDEKGDKVEMPSEFGMQITKEARMTIPYLHFLVNDLDPPKTGDLVEFWANSWEEFGVFYDVVKVSEDGLINDSSFFVQWILELRRRVEYLPERRLLGSCDHE